MRTSFRSLGVLTLLWASACLAQSAPSFEHQLDWGAAADGRLTVQLKLGDLDQTELGSRLTLKMPNWTPGAYGFRGYGERVGELTAHAGSVDGAELEVQHPETDTWIVERGDAVTVVVSYSLPLGGRRRRTSSAGAHFTGPDTYLYLAGHERIGSHDVRMLNLPEGWTLTTGLEQLEGAPHTYRAHDYDELVDCPVSAGPLFVDTVMVRGCPIELCWQGDRELAERANAHLKDDIARIAAWQFDFFGEVPFERYLFQFVVSPGGRGASGLEHRNSTEINLSEAAIFDSKVGLSVIAHEFFHLWNVKRIRSQTINPFDYTRVPQMDALWFHEGVTDYYTSVCLLRTGIYSEEEYLRELGSSWASCNQTDDYYTRGAAWGFALDLEIRSATDNRRSLDDVMRQMNWMYAKPDRGFEQSEGIFWLIDGVAQRDLSSQWLPIVLDQQDADFGPVASLAGMSFKLREISRSPFFGVVADATDEGGIVLREVVAGTSADKAGFLAGDRLLSLDGEAFDAENWQQLIRAAEPGSDIEVRFVRGEQEREVRFAMGYRARQEGRLERDPRASAGQREVLAQFLTTQPFQPLSEPDAEPTPEQSPEKVPAGGYF